VVSATNPHGRQTRFSRPEPLIFHSSNSSIILTRLSGPVPDTLRIRKSGSSAGNRTRDLWICSQEPCETGVCSLEQYATRVGNYFADGEYHQLMSALWTIIHYLCEVVNFQFMFTVN
jgi:hypothetical protein